MGELHLCIEAPLFGLVQCCFKLLYPIFKIYNFLSDLDALRKRTTRGSQRATHRVVATFEKRPFKSGARIAEVRIPLIHDLTDVFKESDKGVERAATQPDWNVPPLEQPFRYGQPKTSE
jgi:hypothetical protein